MMVEVALTMSNYDGIYATPNLKSDIIYLGEELPDYSVSEQDCSRRKRRSDVDEGMRVSLRNTGR